MKIEGKVVVVLSYENIDMLKTGSHLKKTIHNAGYSVKDIQNILHLSCPQPIYRWFAGKVLPSVDHLYMLSKLLKVHMEELLVSKAEVYVKELTDKEKRLLAYARYFNKAA